MVQSRKVRFMMEETFYQMATQLEANDASNSVRLQALEELGGLAPGDVSDATVADLAANSSSLFFEQLRYRRDAASNTKTVFEIDHYGAGNDHAYGIDIQNFPGAASGLVLHQYSSAGNGAFVLDNTGSAPAIRIDNTENTSINPGSVGSGAFFRLSPWNNHEPSRFDLRDDLMWDNASPYGHGVLNWIGGVGFTVEQNVAAIGLKIKQNTGLYGLDVDAIDYGGIFRTSGSLGQALTVERNGTGSTALRVNNKGDGWTIYAADEAGAVWSLAADGEQRSYKAGVGVTLRSAGGTSYKITVSDTGTLTTTLVS